MPSWGCHSVPSSASFPLASPPAHGPPLPHSPPAPLRPQDICGKRAFDLQIRPKGQFLQARAALAALLDPVCGGRENPRRVATGEGVSLNRAGLLSSLLLCLCRALLEMQSLQRF